MRNDVCIVIPVYKPFESLNRNEKAAIRQTCEVFKNRKIYFVSPKVYEDYPVPCTFLLYDEKYFTYSGYNQLCKSPLFYLDFIGLGFRYMCLVQQDVWVFEDRLDYFLGEFDDKNYDYIGAPWYGVWFCKDGEVGNGGFCIRRLDKFADICQRHPIGLGNEDVYFCRTYRNELNMAPEELALEFSFEEKPLHAYRLNHERLPMGTHAYAKCPDRLGFWMNHIKEIYTDSCQPGNPDIYNP